MSKFFDAQGHRGARGLRPENTLPSFELAMDLGVTAIETDLHLTSDDVPVLSHDPWITEALTQQRPGTTAPQTGDHPPLRSLSLAQLRCYRADRNPDPTRFPDQSPDVTPLTLALASTWGIDPYAIPTLAELIGLA